jgi:hypothetical protein
MRRNAHVHPNIGRFICFPDQQPTKYKLPRSRRTREPSLHESCIRVRFVRGPIQTAPFLALSLRMARHPFGRLERDAHIGSGNAASPRQCARGRLAPETNHPIERFAESAPGNQPSIAQSAGTEVLKQPDDRLGVRGRPIATLTMLPSRLQSGEAAPEPRFSHDLTHSDERPRTHQCQYSPGVARLIREQPRHYWSNTDGTLRNSPHLFPRCLSLATARKSSPVADIDFKRAISVMQET